MIASFDTNVIVRLFIKNHAAQFEAAHASLASCKTVHLSDIALIESIFVLNAYYQIPRENVKEYILGLLNTPNIEANKALFKRALPHYASHPKLSIEDCCLAIYAELSNATPLLTFDKKLVTQLPYTELLSISS